jgi:hypothetical protein
LVFLIDQAVNLEERLVVAILAEQPPVGPLGAVETGSKVSVVVIEFAVGSNGCSGPNIDA